MAVVYSDFSYPCSHSVKQCGELDGVGRALIPDTTYGFENNHCAELISKRARHGGTQLALDS